MCAVTAGQAKKTRFNGDLDFARQFVGSEVATEKATSSSQSPSSLFPDICGGAWGGGIFLM